MQFCEVVVEDYAFCGEFADAFVEFWGWLASQTGLMRWDEVWDNAY